MKVFTAIDPGKSGGISSIYVKNGKIIKIEVGIMPMLNDEEYDLQKLRDIMEKISKYDSHVIIENVHSIYGASAKSNFQFGIGVGIVRTAVACFQIPYTLVQSKAWQKVCFQGVKVIEKKGIIGEGRGKIDTKAMAAVAAARLYPKVNVLKSSRAKNPHDGIVDSLLMAHYGKLMFEKG